MDAFCVLTLHTKIIDHGLDIKWINPDLIGVIINLGGLLGGLQGVKVIIPKVQAGPQFPVVLP